MYQHFASLYKKLEVDRLIKLMEIESKKALTVNQTQGDDHFTILKFTSGYKVTFGTPDLDTGQGRAQVHNLESFSSLKSALVHCLAMAAIGRTGLELDEDFPGQAFKCKYND